MIALYDPAESRNGVIKCVSKKEKRRAAEGTTAFGRTIVTPALIEDQTDQPFEYGLRDKKLLAQAQSVPYVPPEVYDAQRRAIQQAKDQKKVTKPEMPPQVRDKGGKTSQSGSLASFVMNNLYKNTQREMDPREALLAHAKDAEADPIWIAPAYKKSQPKPVFDTGETTQKNLKFLEE